MVKIQMFILMQDSIEIELTKRMAEKLSINVFDTFTVSGIYAKHDILANKCLEALLSDPYSFWIIVMDMGWTSRGIAATMQGLIADYDCTRLLYHLNSIVPREFCLRMHVILADPDAEHLNPEYLPLLKRTQIDETGIEPVLKKLIKLWLEDSG